MWQYCEDIAAVNNNGAAVNFNGTNDTDSFNFKTKLMGQTGDKGTKDVEIIVPLKYLSVFWRTTEMPSINCQVNLILTWSEEFAIVSTDFASQNATCKISDTKLYAPVVTSSTQDNA